MIKVMIVDDEMLVRAGIRSTIQWQQLGMEVVAECEDGQEALDAFNQLRPEIVITDIRMPVMDGLELARRLKEIDSQVQIIFLTCYEEFSYAREAIRLDIADYIVKPTMTVDDMTKVLIRLKETLEKEKAELGKLDVLKKKLEEEEVNQRKSLFFNLIRGELTEAQLEDAVSKLHIDSNSGNFALIIWSVDRYKEVAKKYNDKSLSMLLNAMHSIVYDVCSFYGKIIVFDDNRNKLIGLVCFEDKSAKTCFEKLSHIASESKIAFEKYMSISVTIGISELCNEIASLPQAWKQTEKANNRKMFLGYGRIIFHHELQYQKEVNVDCSDIIKQIESSVEVRDVEQFEAALKELFMNRLALTFRYDDVYETCYKLLSIMMSFLSKHGEGKQLLELSKRYSEGTLFTEFETLEEIHEWFLNCFHNLFRLSDSSDNEKMNCKVKKAISFIKERYMHDISLKDAAKYVGVSTNYLGNLFKRETGYYFNNYLMEYRIKKAQQLLKDNSLKIYEVAARVGIPDQHYFSKIFKRITGIAPNEARQ